MFGSNDDKKPSIPSVPASTEKPAEKKDLFGWLRKKPQASANPEPQPTPGGEQPVVPTVTESAAEPVTPVSEEVAVPVVAPVVAAETVAAPQPVPLAPIEPASASAPAQVEASEANPLPRPSRFRINAGSEVLHAHIDVPVPAEPVSAPPVAEPAAVQPAAAPAKSAEENPGWASWAAT